MRYTAAQLQYAPHPNWVGEMFEQEMADVGFDCFEQEGDDPAAKKAYIPTRLLNRERLQAVLDRYEWVTLLGLDECPDQNWNAEWEKEHPILQLPLGVTIVPHCAFGAGSHETTSMMVEALLNTDLHGKKVLDNGCGTGILGIIAHKAGAASVTAVDIDENSVANTHENAVRNGTNLLILQGDTPPEGTYDLILSNIHRNILLQQMPLYARYLSSDGSLWLSGFYETDLPVLSAAAAQYGLAPYDQMQRGEWCLLKVCHLSKL